MSAMYAMFAMLVLLSGVDAAPKKMVPDVIQLNPVPNANDGEWLLTVLAYANLVNAMRLAVTIPRGMRVTWECPLLHGGILLLCLFGMGRAVCPSASVMTTELGRGVVRVVMEANQVELSVAMGCAALALFGNRVRYYCDVLESDGIHVADVTVATPDEMAPLYWPFRLVLTMTQDARNSDFVRWTGLPTNMQLVAGNGHGDAQLAINALREGGGVVGLVSPLQMDRLVQMDLRERAIADAVRENERNGY